MNEQADMYMKQRRIRGSNFSKEEELLLVMEVEKYKNIIECKATDKISNTDKNKAWKKIESSFNAKNNSFRGIHQLKIKYDNLKMKTRKTIAEIKCSWNGIGGGPAANTVVDPVIETMLRIRNKDTVNGVSNSFNSDTSVSEINEVCVGENIDKVIKDEDDASISLMDSKILILPVEDESVESSNVEELSNDWSTYASKKLNTPLSKKPLQQAPLPVRDDFYRKKIKLIEQEIKKNELIMEDILLKRKRDEEEHQKKMLLLDIEIKLKQKQLNM